jgi:hypothetical protein
MNSEPIRTGAGTAEVWQMAQRRRGTDMATLFGKPANEAVRPAAARRRRLAISTVFAALVAAVAVWAVAGPPLHRGKTVAAIMYARAP